MYMSLWMVRTVLLYKSSSWHPLAQSFNSEVKFPFNISVSVNQTLTLTTQRMNGPKQETVNSKFPDSLPQDAKTDMIISLV